MIDVTESITGPLFSESAMVIAGKAGLVDAAQLWNDEIMDTHFDTSAETKYRYAKRTVLYSINKAKKFHHQRSLVYSGKSEAAARSMVRYSSRKVRGQEQLRGSAVYPLMPRYFYYRSTPKQPDKLAEFTATTPFDEQRLLERYREKCIAYLNGTEDPVRGRADGE